MKRWNLSFALLAGLSFFAAGNASAQGYVLTDRFGYSGTISRYTSYGDAVAGTNAVSGSPFSVPARDLSLYLIDGNAAYGAYSNTAQFESAWFLNNEVTPSNQNTGFIQHSDLDGASVTSMSTSWDASLTTFTFSVIGGNGQPGCSQFTDDCGRLWNAGSALGSAETTGGMFLNYQLSFVATGLDPATWNPGYGVYESNSNPTGVIGSLWGIFQNTSTEDPSSNGFYVANLGIDMNSLYGTESDSYFGSDNVVPEPATLTLLATGLVGMAGAARRRRKTTR